MASSKMLHHLATNPAAYMRFQATGQLPETVKPRSPLISLLKRISQRDLGHLVGVTVGEKLGYTGSRTFRYGIQALNWASPPGEHLRSDWPAESWRNKRFSAQLYLEDLLECCLRYPPDFASRYPELCRPAPRRAAPAPAAPVAAPPTDCAE